MELNNQQRKAAEYSGPKTHLLVLAGAGTGKTRTIIARAAHLLKNQIAARRIVLLTFTRRAAAEMTHRLELETGDLSKGIFAGTFHRFCLDIMKTIPKTFGVESFTVIDADDQLGLMGLIRGATIQKSDKKHFPKAAHLLDYYSYSRNTCMEPREYLMRYTELSPEVNDTIVRIFASYEARKKERNYIDFDDILYIFLETLRKNEALRKRLKELFDHILVDEMQDTNPLQWGILEMLAGPARLFCVGDDAQSIYGFRGADFRNVHAFSARMPDSETIRLELNYRSTQEILDLANWLLGKSALGYNRKLEAIRGSGTRPSLVDFLNPFDEAKWYGEEILRRHEQGYRYSDFMILVRTSYLARRIEAVFVEMKIPYKFIGGTALMQSAHVRDLFSLLRAAINFKDELAWIRYLKLWPKVGDVTSSRAVEVILKAPEEKESFETLKNLFKWEPHIPEAIDEVRQNLGNPSNAINTAIRLLEPLLSNRYDHWPSRSRDLEMLTRLANRFSKLGEFLETYTLDPVYNSDVEGTDKTDDAVTIITIHSAKGTEAPVCMIPQAIPGVYPHARAIGNADDIEEERRILYVALTRAQNELILTRAGGPGKTVFMGGSGLSGTADKEDYFFSDLPDGLTDNDLLGPAGGKTFLDDLAGFE
jgi:DNA helicase-2/ATP-dependent DNA helicase PcrA